MTDKRERALGLQQYQEGLRSETEVLKRELVKEARVGYVKLADDQTLPELLDGNRPRAKAFSDMIAAGWRKVELAP